MDDERRHTLPNRDLCQIEAVVVQTPQRHAESKEPSMIATIDIELRIGRPLRGDPWVIFH